MSGLAQSMRLLLVDEVAGLVTTLVTVREIRGA